MAEIIFICSSESVSEWKMFERSFILIHHNGEITNKTKGATFCSQNLVCVSVSSSITLLELQNTILRKLWQLNWNQITEVVYRLPTTVGQGEVRYTTFLVGSDEDVSLMFYYHSQCLEIRVIELFITLEYTNVSSGGSAPNPSSIGIDFSARGSKHNLVACPTLLPVPSPTFTLYCPLYNEGVQHGNTEDMGNGRSFE